MRSRFKKGKRGFTLVELIIILAVLAVLAAVVIPNISGFLGRGKRAAFNGEKETIQIAVDAYYGDETVHQKVGKEYKDGPGVYPTYSGKGGNWTLATWDEKEARDIDSPIINMSLLINKGYLKDYPKSADDFNAPSGTRDGHYTWYVNAKGEVSARYWDKDKKKWLEGYQKGIYP